MPCLRYHDHKLWPTSGSHELRIEACETLCGWCGYKTASANNLRAHARRHLASHEDVSLKGITIVKGKAGRSRVRMTSHPEPEPYRQDNWELIRTGEDALSRCDHEEGSEGSTHSATASHEEITRYEHVSTPPYSPDWGPPSSHSRAPNVEVYQASTDPEGSNSQNSMGDSTSQEREMDEGILSALYHAATATNPDDTGPESAHLLQRPPPLVPVLMKTPFGLKEVLVEQGIVNDADTNEQTISVHNVDTNKALAGTSDVIKLASVASSSSSSYSTSSGDVERTFGNRASNFHDLSIADYKLPSLDILSSAATLSELSNRTLIPELTDDYDNDLNLQPHPPKPPESYLRTELVPNKDVPTGNVWPLTVNPRDCIGW